MQWQQSTYVICQVDGAGNKEASAKGVKREGEDAGGGELGANIEKACGGRHDYNDDDCLAAEKNNNQLTRRNTD